MEDIRENNCEAATIQVTKYWKSEHSDEGSKRKYGLDERSTLLIFAIQTILISGSKIICDFAILIDCKWVGSKIWWACLDLSCSLAIALEERIHIYVRGNHGPVSYFKPHEAHVNHKNSLIIRFNTNFINTLTNFFYLTFLHFI